MDTKNDIRPLLNTGIDQVAKQDSKGLLPTAHGDRIDQPAGTQNSQKVSTFLDEPAEQLPAPKNSIAKHFKNGMPTIEARREFGPEAAKLLVFNHNQKYYERFKKADQVSTDTKYRRRLPLLYKIVSGT